MGKRTKKYCMDEIAFIVKDARFYILCEQIHVLPPILQATCQHIDIVFSVNGVWMLVDIVITNPTRANLVSREVLSCGVVDTQQTSFSFQPQKSLVVCISKPMVFFIDVPTWHGALRALRAFLFWFCIHFTFKACQWCCSEHKRLLF